MRISKRARKALINTAVMLVLVGVTLIILFTSNRELNFENIGIFLKGCDYRWIAAAVLAMLLFVVFEALSLHFILRGLGEKPKFHSSLVYSTSDVYYSAITPSASGGQPASAFYMMKDGVGAGKASFALVYNLIAYTAAIIVIGILAFAVRPEFFGQIDNWLARLLIILGFVVQGLLLLFFIACMFCGWAVLKLGNGIINLLVKIHIVKKPDKWREKLKSEVEKYKDCRHAIKTHPGMTVANFLFNLLQRFCHLLTAMFVCLAVAPQANILDLFALEAFVLVGYNSVPIPGGVGAFEFLYLNIYSVALLGEVFPLAAVAVGLSGDAFILAAMMVSRVISYYLKMIICGVYTLVYHTCKLRNPKKNHGETHNEEHGEEA